MIGPVVILNDPDERQLDNVLSSMYLDLLRCSNLEELKALPKGKAYYRYIIGPSGAITPEQLASWMAMSVGPGLLLKESETVSFIGEVPNQAAYAEVVQGHFGLFESEPKVVVINGPVWRLTAFIRSHLGKFQSIPCATFKDLKILPAGFYEAIAVGPTKSISVRKLRKWMDAKIPKHRHYQVRIFLDGGDHRFLEVPRRHLPQR